MAKLLKVNNDIINLDYLISVDYDADYPAKLVLVYAVRQTDDKLYAETFRQDRATKLYNGLSAAVDLNFSTYDDEEGGE